MVLIGLARLVAASHLAYIVFLLVGGFAAKRWPKLMKWHLGAIGAAAVVNITGSDCPLTVWEKWFLRQAGREPYETGFISNYLVEPVYPSGITGRVNFVILVALTVPITVGYWRLIKRRRGGWVAFAPNTRVSRGSAARRRQAQARRVTNTGDEHGTA
ncbi:MAG: DUF2784 domain-containing protein [Acidimicrobiaceae bacterium]|nr:DUF2784 domain-containing protein [Acidimicrobiaceae bacterium]